MTINATSTDTPIAIPDNDPVGITSYITITTTGIVESGAWTVQVIHPRPRDLTIHLSDGEITNTIVTSDSMFNPWMDLGDGVYTASGGISFFEGQTTDGTWSINVVDEISDNSGTLDFWSLDIETASISGVGDAGLSLTGNGAGQISVIGSGAPTFGLIASGSGRISLRGTAAAALSLSASGRGFIDWVSELNPVQIQEVYRLVITGSADGLLDLYIGQISSWQATNQAEGRAVYLQAVIPAAESVLPEIEARQNGDLAIEKGFKFLDGSTRYEQIIRTSFDTLRPDRGRRALTVTVSGYRSGKVLSNGNRKLTGIRTISASNGKRRVRCDIDLFLQPGMTVDSLSDSFTVGFVNYYVTQADKFAEVGEA